MITSDIARDSTKYVAHQHVLEHVVAVPRRRRRGNERVSIVNIARTACNDV